ncbi:MAG: hypothetical protein Q9220_007806 [cf. Caloplaca sp. 1 TL-2023]
MAQWISKITAWILPKKENRIAFLRTYQCFFILVWIVCIALVVVDSGRWSYESLKITVALGCESILHNILNTLLAGWLANLRCIALAVAFTVIIYIVHIFGYDGIAWQATHPLYREMPMNIPRMIFVSLRILIDLGVAALWGMAFVTSWLPKKTNFQKLFDEPPYAEWYMSAAAEVIEWCVYSHTKVEFVCLCLCTQRAFHGISLLHPVQLPVETGSRSARLGAGQTTTQRFTQAVDRLFEIRYAGRCE